MSLIPPRGEALPQALEIRSLKRNRESWWTQLTFQWEFHVIREGRSLRGSQP